MVNNAIINYLFKKDFTYLVLERGEGKEKERERNIPVWFPLTYPPLGTWPATQARALTGNGTGDPLLFRLVLNPPTHTSQGWNKQSYARLLCTRG